MRRNGHTGRVCAHRFREMADTLLQNGDAIRDSFREWHAEQESLDGQLAESLSALTAYQSHLDAWQQQLAHERDELNRAREQFERERVVGETTGAQSKTESTAELSAAQENIAALTSSLSARTEELHTLDNRRAELVTELDLARAHEKELKAALEEQKQAQDHERAQWAAELRHVRETSERGVEASELIRQDEVSEQPTVSDPPRATGAIHPDRRANSANRLANNPVLSSIVEQFGKLRQQRATDRQALRKTR